MPADSRTIVVMRHAKAEEDGPNDVERALAARGHRDAAATGAWLAARGLVPAHALVSAARRTRETWKSVASAGGWAVAPDLDLGLYSAGVEAALDLVRRIPDDVSTTVLLGHNPTVASLAQLLDDGEGDQGAATEMTQGFPTSALAVFTVPGAWSDLTLGGATLRAFHVARG